MSTTHRSLTPSQLSTPKTHYKSADEIALEEANEMLSPAHAATSSGDSARSIRHKKLDEARSQAEHVHEEEDHQQKTGQIHDQFHTGPANWEVAEHNDDNEDLYHSSIESDEASFQENIVNARNFANPNDRELGEDDEEDEDSYRSSTESDEEWSQEFIVNARKFATTQDSKTAKAPGDEFAEQADVLRLGGDEKREA
jgi:hypothetical protein